MNESKSIPEVTQSPFANGELAREPMQFMQEILQRQQRSTSRSNSSRTSRMIRGSDAAGADFHSGSVRKLAWIPGNERAFPKRTSPAICDGA